MRAAWLFGARRLHSPPTAIARATTPKFLYQNLLRLLASPQTASLPVLVDYHELHPDVRSARSYNLLISLAIRHVAYGTVQLLLNGMSADHIPENLETVKLRTRYLVRLNNWEYAWQQVTASHRIIPLPLWMEFFNSVKRTGTSVDARSDTPLAIPETRFRTLMLNLPTFSPNGRESVHAVLIIVRAMLTVNKPKSAMSFVTQYFHALPQRIDRKWANHCVLVMNALIAYEAKKRGLLDFYSARRKLNSILAIHPDLRPSSKTLLLLLGTLRQARQCGTISWHTLTKFKTRWGPQVEDQRVRRRVASYAIIEGRLGIFDKVLVAEQESWRDITQSEPLRETMRPFREVFPRRGRERQLWRSLAARAMKVRLRLQQSRGNKL
ncbi:hypothetical protein C8F01DRAFT_519388 [Mycena amicta]|nr:hypothetical protein C8F01DRAFT_519388 [Mycena amicta]